MLSVVTTELVIPDDTTAAGAVEAVKLLLCTLSPAAFVALTLKL